MKKILYFIISLVIILTLCSCTKDAKTVQDQKQEKPKEVTWGMTFKETRSIMEDEHKIPFAEGAHYVGGHIDGYKFRIFSTDDFNELGEADLLFHHGDEDSLDAMYIELSETSNKDDFLNYLTNKFGDYTSLKNQPAQTLDNVSVTPTRDIYIWDKDEFYGELIVAKNIDSSKANSVIFNVAKDKETYRKIWKS